MEFGVENQIERRPGISFPKGFFFFGTWQDSDLGSDNSKEQEDQQDSSSDRDTHFNPDSSPKLPADLDADADRTAQAEFEEAVADGSCFADPDFEWEPGDEGS